MSDHLQIEAGELTVDEIIDALRDGKRISVQAEVFGAPETMTLRHDGTTFYCDTPTTLHKHESETEMRGCIEDMGYGRTVGDE